MSNVAGAQAPTKRFAHQTLGVEDLRENVEDLGKSVGDMATRQPAVSERLLGSASGGSLSVVHFVSNSGMGRDGFHIDRAGAFDVESSGSGLKLPPERLDTGTPIESHTGKRLSFRENVFHSHSY